MTFVHKTFARVQGPPSIARRVQTAIWWRLYSCVLLCYWVNTNFSLSQMLYKAKDHHTRCCLILFSKRLLIFFNSLNFFYFSVYNWNRQYVTRLDLLVTMAKWKRRVFIFKKKSDVRWPIRWVYSRHYQRPGVCCPGSRSFIFEVERSPDR
jgi:hypothetical protein